MIDRVQYQALVFGMVRKVWLIEKRMSNCEAGLAVTRAILLVALR